jgi:magnesium-protoporphyrin O-methyltransferase
VNCCQCDGLEEEFDRVKAASDLERYRSTGPDNSTQVLLDALKDEDVQGMSLLDIGGGVGVVQLELLKADVKTATSVEASNSYTSAAREEAERQGYSDHIRYEFGNFVDLAEGIPKADIVTLDRVICCYKDIKALVGLSAARASKLYGVVYPRDYWLEKARAAIENIFHWLRGEQYRVYVHSSTTVDALIRGAGLNRRSYRQTSSWQIVVYGR